MKVYQPASNSVKPTASELVAEALAYLTRGFGAIPVRRKEAIVKWKVLQSRLPTEAEVRSWPWGRATGLALVLGEHLAVLDIDDPTAAQQLDARAPTWTCAGRPGRTKEIFAAPAGGVATRQLTPGVQLLGRSSIAVVPPSFHRLAGRRYEWLPGHSPDDLPLAPLPTWVADLIRPTSKTGAATPVEDWRRLIADGVSDGQRNDALARLTGHLLRRRVDPWVTVELLQAWNLACCRPPLTASEVLGVVDSIAGREAQQRRRWRGWRP